MRKRVVSRTIDMVNGTATIIDGDTVSRWMFDAPQAVCRDYDILRGYIGVINGRIVEVEVHDTYTAKAVMDELDFILASSIEAVKGGVDNE